MSSDLIAERIIVEDDDRAGGLARLMLYATAGAAALVGAWLLAAPSLGTSPAPETVSTRMAPLPVDNVRQIDMTASAPATPVAAPEPAASLPAAVKEAPVTAPAETAAVDPLPIPPKPIPRPAHVAAAPAPVAVARQDVAVVQRGAPPADLGVLREPAAAPVYVPPQPAVYPAAAEPAGPVPPMPIADQADDVPPPGAAVRHGGLLGASEQAVGTAWNWTTGTVNGMVRGVQQGF